MHRAVDEFLNEPRVGLRRLAGVDREMACERTRVGEQPDASAREGGTGEVARVAPDRLLELLRAVGEGGVWRADLELVAELLEGTLVVDLGEGPEGRRVEPGHR